MPKMLYALMKWIGGDDDKKYTTGIPIEWIKNFDISEFLSEKFDPLLSYVIEWRSTRKCPPGGWAVYDGYVIAVSASIQVLEKKLQMLNGLLSPTKSVVFPTVKEDNVDQSTSQTTSKNTLQTNNSRVKQHFRRSSTIEENSDSAASASPKSSHDTAEVPRENSELFGLRKKPRDDERMSGIAPHRKTKSKVRLYQPTRQGAEEGNLTQVLAGVQKELQRLRKKRSREDSSDSSA